MVVFLHKSNLPESPPINLVNRQRQAELPTNPQIIKELKDIPQTRAMKNMVYSSGIQPGVRIPPGVCEDILGGT
jgi:hypothetical protein